MLAVKLLGQYTVLLGDQPVDLHERAAQLLLAYLLLNRQRQHSRESLSALLWPDSSPTNARSNLRHALWRLRQALDTPHGNYVRAHDAVIYFDGSLPLRLDVAGLEAPFADDATAAEIGAVVSLYEGELLPGFDAVWIVLERERLRAVFERQICLLLRQLAAEGRWQDVIDWSERWIAQGGAPEPGYRALMRAYGARGELSQVVAVYQRCLTALGDELGVVPSPVTRRLYEDLLGASRLPPGARMPEVPEDLRRPTLAGTPPATGVANHSRGAHAAGLWPALLFGLLIVLLALLFDQSRQTMLAGGALPPPGQTQLRYTVHGTGGVAFSPDGALLATTDLGGAAVIRDSASGAALRSLSGHADQVINLAFCPNGEYLVTASLDGTARLWHVADGRLLHVFDGHKGGLLTPACSPDSSLVATTGFDGTARLWETAGGTPRRRLVHQSTTSGPSFSPDGTLLAVPDRKAVRIWNVASGRLGATLPAQDIAPTAAAFSPDGSHLLIIGNSREAQVWPPEGEAPRLTLRGHVGWLSAGAYRADGKVIVTGSEDGTVRFWDAEDGTSLLVIPGSAQGVGSLSLSQDGALLAVAGNDGLVRVWALPVLAAP